MRRTLLLAAAVLAAAPATAGAAGPGFSVAAVGFDSYFQYRLKPGAVARGQLRVVNQSRHARHVVLRAADVTTAAGGGLEYGTGDPRGLGRWIRLAASEVTVAPGSARDIPFTVHAGAHAQAGDALAGIVA